jgi:hypothetical protein
MERKCIGSINSEKHDTEGTPLPGSTLEIDSSSFQDVVVVERVEYVLRPKRMAGSDSGDDLLGERSSLADVFQRFLHVLGDESEHDCERDGDHRDDGGHGECKFPLADVGENETSDESGQKTNCYRDLFGNTLLHEI